MNHQLCGEVPEGYPNQNVATERPCESPTTGAF